MRSHDRNMITPPIPASYVLLRTFVIRYRFTPFSRLSSASFSPLFDLLCRTQMFSDVSIFP